MDEVGELIASLYLWADTWELNDKAMNCNTCESKERFGDVACESCCGKR